MSLTRVWLSTTNSYSCQNHFYRTSIEKYYFEILFNQLTTGQTLILYMSDKAVISFIVIIIVILLLGEGQGSGSRIWLKIKDRLLDVEIWRKLQY